MNDEPLYDVLAVGFDGIVRWVVNDYTRENAEAVQHMAVIRQGVMDQFYAVEPAGKYKIGDKR